MLWVYLNCLVHNWLAVYLRTAKHWQTTQGLCTVFFSKCFCSFNLWYSCQWKWLYPSHSSSFPSTSYFSSLVYSSFNFFHNHPNSWTSINHHQLVLHYLVILFTFLFSHFLKHLILLQRSEQQFPTSCILAKLGLSIAGFQVKKLTFYSYWNLCAYLCCLSFLISHSVCHSYLYFANL